MECDILPMTLDHFNKIEPVLTTEFDSFWKPSILKQELENTSSKYFIAINKNDILGFGGVWKAVDEYHITDIVVKKSSRSLGIGSLILEKLIQVVKDENVASITLEVNVNNIPAQKLYEKYGFKSVGVRKKYYNNTDDAIIMTLFLN